MNSSLPQPDDTSQPFARRLGLFDTTMLVMGGIVGAGIFINPYVVARQVHTPALVLGAWITGGAFALTAAFIWAELANRMPEVGGQYAYLRDSYHPLVAFLYGWVLLLVIQTGGMAAVTVTFARYFLDLTGWHVAEWQVAIITLLALTVVNCFGVRAGGTLQSALMAIKILAIALLVGAGMFFIHKQIPWHPLIAQKFSPAFASTFGAALIPVVFAYGGWQTASFAAGEMKNPRRDLPRALVLGVAGVALLYTLVNYVCVRALGVSVLAETRTPASQVMQMAMGSRGVTIIALGIAVSTLGFLSQSVLTAPRVYFAMAEDGVFFRQLAWVHPRTRVPAIAIIAQSVWTLVILLFGSYDKILNYVVSIDALFWGLTAGCLFVLRHRTQQRSPSSMPGHPYTTAIFCLVCGAVVANAIYTFPSHTLIGVGILVTGIPVYYIWKWIPRT